MITLFQLLFLLFALVAILGVIKKKRDGALGPKGALFWGLFWCAAIVAVLWPNSTTILANRFGIGRGTDFVLYVALATMFYVLFRLHIKIESIGRDVTKVVRQRALGGVETKDSN